MLTEINITAIEPFADGASFGDDRRLRARARHVQGRARSSRRAQQGDRQHRQGAAQRGGPRRVRRGILHPAPGGCRARQRQDSLRRGEPRAQGDAHALHGCAAGHARRNQRSQHAGGCRKRPPAAPRLHAGVEQPRPRRAAQQQRHVDEDDTRHEQRRAHRARDPRRDRRRHPRARARREGRAEVEDPAPDARSRVAGSVESQAHRTPRRSRSARGNSRERLEIRERARNRAAARRHESRSRARSTKSTIPRRTPRCWGRDSPRCATWFPSCATIRSAGNPARPGIKAALAYGSSWSGRFLRDFIHLGFNQDESARKVFDGVFSHIAGGGGVFLNYEFGQPVRTSTQHEDRAFPETQFPFSAARMSDPHSGRTDSLFRNDGFDPLLIETNTSTEYWQKGASLLTTDPLGKRDIELPANSRVYLVAGTQHGGTAGMRATLGPVREPAQPAQPQPGAARAARCARRVGQRRQGASGVPRAAPGRRHAGRRRRNCGFRRFPACRRSPA